MKQSRLDLYGALDQLAEPEAWHSFLSVLYAKEWIVYCKPPFRNADSVVKYLGRYTHRVAISNSRILSATEAEVSFKWRDYKDGSKWKIMTLPAHEFIRRFLIHVLPTGFCKIRHYGFLASRNKSIKLLLCKTLTHTPLADSQTLSDSDLIQKMLGVDISRCPCCGSDKLCRVYCYGDSS